MGVAVMTSTWGGRPVCLLFQRAGALLDAEAVLFVGDGEAEVLELDPVFEQGVGADDEVQVSPDGELFEHGLAGLSFHISRQETHPDAEAFEVFGNGLVVLLGQDLCGRHEGGLVAVVEGDEHAQHGHHGLAAAHVALQQAVHLNAQAEVAAYLFDDPFLRIGELEGNFFLVIAVEELSDLLEDVAFRRGVAAVFELEEAQLEQKELFEFEALAGGLEFFLVFRKMDGADGRGARREAKLFEQVVRQVFGQIGGLELLEQFDQ
jgi:hypothetical protein